MKERIKGISGLAVAGVFAVAGCASESDGFGASPTPKPDYLDRAYISEFSLIERHGFSGDASLTHVMTCYSVDRPTVEISNDKSNVVFDSTVICNKSEDFYEGYFDKIGIKSGKHYSDLILATQYEVTVKNQE